MRIPISALINGHPPQPRQTLHCVNLYGRDFFVWKGRVYPFPWDESQRDLLDVLHKFIYEAVLGSRLHVSQLRNDAQTPLRVLDVGYGTGHWTIEMAERYPTAEITGIDLVPFLITNAADNLNNISPVDFMSDEWPVPSDSQDLIHLALLCGSVPDWAKLYRTAYKHLKPAVGQIEHIEIDWAPRAAGPGPYPAEGQAMLEWWNRTVAAAERGGCSMRCPENTEELLEDIGFVDVSRKKFRIPFDDNPWDPYEQDLSDWFRAAMAHSGPFTTNSFASLSLFHLTTQLKMAEADVRTLCKNVVKEVNKKYTPLYCNLYVYTARKPVRLPHHYRNDSVFKAN